jgi:hypothetical protein
MQERTWGVVPMSAQICARMSDIFPHGSVGHGSGDGLASSGVRRGALAPLASWVVKDNFLRFAQKCP